MAARGESKIPPTSISESKKHLVIFLRFYFIFLHFALSQRLVFYCWNLRHFLTTVHRLKGRTHPTCLMCPPLCFHIMCIPYPHVWLVKRLPCHQLKQSSAVSRRAEPLTQRAEQQSVSLPPSAFLCLSLPLSVSLCISLLLSVSPMVGSVLSVRRRLTSKSWMSALTGQTLAINKSLMQRH